MPYEVLTSGHLLIGKPLEAVPDPTFSYRSISLLRHWHLCQATVCHFWKSDQQSTLSLLDVSQSGII